MPYPPALSKGSPVATYASISSSVSSANSTVVVSLNPRSNTPVTALTFGNSIATPVCTLELPFDSARSISFASRSSLGFSITAPSRDSTTVSAPIMTSGTPSPTSPPPSRTNISYTSLAFAIAVACAYACAPSYAFLSKSSANDDARTTTSVSPSARKMSRRRGLPLASTMCDALSAVTWVRIILSDSTDRSTTTTTPCDGCAVHW
mmetsp:Transcript_7657/g.28037  ORF Transcript_7657/g.28037 Transcript_7657/m.28037 type:complete len:206 (+) Transcript_7657:1385-2002(+)